tara:strand:+ start:1492 stop:1926 length:435 start_codon:yes stop_codon:yes gene_type:complete
MDQKSIGDSSFIPPQLTDIRDCWDTIKHGIRHILEDDPGLTFRPEDVYSDCVNQKAFLYTSSVGFIVFVIQVDEFTKDRTLLIWLGYTYIKGDHRWVTHKEWFSNLAKEAGCRYLEQRSIIKELEPYYLKNGWELSTRVYIKEV